MQIRILMNPLGDGHDNIGCYRGESLLRWYASFEEAMVDLSWEAWLILGLCLNFIEWRWGKIVDVILPKKQLKASQYHMMIYSADVLFRENNNNDHHIPWKCKNDCSTLELQVPLFFSLCNKSHNINRILHRFSISLRYYKFCIFIMNRRTKSQTDEH